MVKQVLIIATSNDKMGDTGKLTGCWAEEIMAPFVMFKAKGYDVTVASIKGGKIPIDASSLEESNVTDKTRAFELDNASASPLDTSQPLKSVVESKYDAIFIPGGHGVMWDMIDNSDLANLIARHFESGKIVSSVCHGPAAFAYVKLKDGTYMVKNKQVTCFSNSEEKVAGTESIVPWCPEDKLREHGGDFSKAEDWAPYAVQDGNLITGQNPKSSEAVAEKVIAALGD